MVRAALTFGWLVVLPGLVVWAFTPTLVTGLRVDTSRATADRIRPGMTLAEVEQIIGAPPGTYGVEPHFRFVSGNRWPYPVDWSSPGGHIEVIDGEFGFTRDSSTGQAMNTDMRKPDGIVDSVRWYPATERGGSWEEIGARAVLVYTLFAVVYVCCWVIPRRADAAAARCVSAAGGG